ncbi:MAG: hypothetical protein PVI57_12860 [Gemmatimonadota bacterium]|jgi:hypothetical protein
MESDSTRNRTWKITAVTVLAAAAAAAVAAFVVRDQMSRHRRNLFSPHALRRLAALGYMAGEDASVDNITLLRDFIAWEPRRMLRNRARAIVRRMEEEAHARGLPGEAAATADAAG